MSPRTLLSSALLLACTATASAQYPLPLPARGLAPLMHVKLIGPAGMHAVVYQGMARPRDLAAPVQLGLRPGYIYRLELNGFPQAPGVSLYPTLEVRGSLCLAPVVNPAQYPAPIVITEDDLRQALAGVLVTKVIYLEHPERAVPTATTPNQPLETNIPSDHDLLADARERGRPVLVLRFGQLQMTAEEVALSSVPGTVLFPDEHVLGQPAAQPMLPWACFPWYDPIAGPRPDEECIHNGCINPPNPRYLVNGKPLRAGLDNEGQLQGLNPEDTVAEYRDSRGWKRLACSNRVCLCVPRFGVLRSELGLGRYDSVTVVEDKREVRGQEQVRVRVPSLQTQHTDQPGTYLSRARPTQAVTVEGLVKLTRLEVLDAHHLSVGPIELLGSDRVNLLRREDRVLLMQQMEFARALSRKTGLSGYETIVGTEVIGRVVGGPEVVSSSVETRDLTVCCNEAPRPPEKPLVLFKCADKHAAQPGDVVTFTLKFSNHGGLPITDVAVVDSLSGRLEYLPGTAQADRDSVFTMQQNEAGSLVLRWEVSGKLLPGDSGTIRFQAKVR